MPNEIWIITPNSDDFAAEPSYSIYSSWIFTIFSVMFFILSWAVIYFQLYLQLWVYNSQFLYIFLIPAAVPLCSVALFFQRTAPTACQGPCNGSSNGLLGD